MNPRKALGQAIAHLRKHAKLSQVDMQEKTGIDQGAISRMENGKQTIYDEQMVAIANALKVQVSEIWAMAEALASEQIPVDIPSTLDVGMGTRIVPLIGWVQAGQWAEQPDMASPMEPLGYVQTTARVSKRAFALEVVGESMINPRGEPSFPPGTRVIVEPERSADNGAFVIAQVAQAIGDPETTFKRLMMDAGQHYLMPLNPQFSTLPIDRETRICGVVVSIAEKSLIPG